jgi:hypothetical protein
MEILARETGGKSYKSHKYSLDDSERSAIEYGEVEKSVHWKRRGETETHTKYINLKSLGRV